MEQTFLDIYTEADSDDETDAGAEEHINRWEDADAYAGADADSNADANADTNADSELRNVNFFTQINYFQMNLPQEKARKS